MNLRKFDSVKTTLYGFLRFSYDVVEFGNEICPQFLVTVSFVEIGSKIPYFTYRCKLISIRKVRIFFQIWVKFGAKYLQIFLLFTKIISRKFTLFMDVDEATFILLV